MECYTKEGGGEVKNKTTGSKLLEWSQRPKSSSNYEFGDLFLKGLVSTLAGPPGQPNCVSVELEENSAQKAEAEELASKINGDRQRCINVFERCVPLLTAKQQELEALFLATELIELDRLSIPEQVPSTRSNAAEFMLLKRLRGTPPIIEAAPVKYDELLKEMQDSVSKVKIDAKIVSTAKNSGNIQVLLDPCEMACGQADECETLARDCETLELKRPLLKLARDCDLLPASEDDLISPLGSETECDFGNKA